MPQTGKGRGVYCLHSILISFILIFSSILYFSLSRAYAADKDIEFGVADDLTVQGEEGSINDADLEIEGNTTTQRQVHINTEGLSTPFGGIGVGENLLTHSEALDDSTWSKTNITASPETDTSIYAPDGQDGTAEVLTNSGASNGYVSQIVSSGISVSTEYVFSVWLRAGTASSAEIKIEDDDSQSNTYTITNLPAKWKRYEVSFTTGSSATQITVSIINTGADTETIYAWGAQLEQASHARVYVMTDASPVSAITGASINGDLRLGSGIFNNPSSSSDLYITGNLEVDGTIYGTVANLDTDNIHDSDNDTKVQVEESSDEDYIRFDTAGVERMYIDNSGNVDIDSNTLYIDASNDRVGVGTSSPEFALTLDGDGAIIAKGTYGSGASLSTSGAGARLIWYPRKAAFRAGYVNGTQWDDSNIGNYSVAFGRNNSVTGTSSGVFSGDGNSVTANDAAILTGNYNTVSGLYSAIINGGANQISSAYGVAGGRYMYLSGRNSFVFGYAEAEQDITQDDSAIFYNGREGLRFGINTLSPSETLSVTNIAFASVQYYDGGASSYTDDTTEAASVGGTAYTVLSDTGDYVYIGNDTTFRYVYFDFAQPASSALSLVFEYYNGSAWTSFTPTSDGTNGFSQDGLIDLGSVNMQNTTVNGVTEKWVRISCSSAPSAAVTAYMTIPNNHDRLSIYAQANDSNPAFKIDKTGNVVISGEGTLELQGNARHTRIVRLSPEYASVVFSADGTNNSGTLLSGMDTQNNYFYSYYQWATSQTTLQDYDLYVRWQVPMDFDGFPSGTNDALIVDIATATTTATDNAVDVTLYKDGASASSSVTDKVSTSAGTWMTDQEGTAVVAFDDSDTVLSSLSAGDVLVIKITLKANNTNSGWAKVGTIRIKYLSKW